MTPRGRKPSAIAVQDARRKALGAQLAINGTPFNPNLEDDSDEMAEATKLIIGELGGRIIQVIRNSDAP